METCIHYHDDVTIIEPHGKIVGPGVLVLRTAILPHIGANDEPRIVINFEHVHRVSSSGLGMLVQANALARRKNGRMAVIHISKHINNLLVLSRLSSLFEHFETEREAISALSDPPHADLTGR